MMNVAMQVMVSGVRHPLCSEACFTKFRRDKCLVADECSQCSKATTAEVLDAHTTQFNGATHRSVTIGGRSR